MRVEWAVLKEGFEERLERLEPGVGEGIRGVWYCEVLGDRRDEGWLVRVGDARGLVGLNFVISR